MQPVTYSELMSDNDAPRQSCERGESAVKAARPISGQTSAPFEGYIKVSRVNVRWVEFRLKKKTKGEPVGGGSDEETSRFGVGHGC